MDQAANSKQQVEAESLPPHLNNDYIQAALAQAFSSEKLKVESCNIECITRRGENFCSAIYRVHVAYRKCLKSPLEHGTFILKDLLPEVTVANFNEWHMFQKVLPAMEKILEQAVPLLNASKLSAKCFFAERAVGRELYLLEDLNALGYKTLDRFTGLTHAEALVCLEKLAHFHAASMVLLQQEPQLVEELSPCQYAAGVEEFFAAALALDGTAFAAEEVANYAGMSHIAEKMRNQLPKIYNARMKEVVNPKRAAIKVIVHGDLWLNNILSTTEQPNAILVDFQHAFVGSPAIDLQFFFYTSLQLDVLLQKREALLEHYHSSLVETLRRCHYSLPLPSYEMLLAEMQSCLFYGYFAAVCELPTCCSSKEAAENFTVHTYFDKEAMRAKRQQLFQNERVCQTLKAALEYFNEQGVLDYY